jgi:crossover junction endodeoxyribonuclease RuvC
VKVAGVDLSLSSTGVALIDRDPDEAPPARVEVHLVKPKRIFGLQRLRWITERIWDLVATRDLVVLEGPAYGMTAGQRGHHERAGLWWHLAEHIDWRGVRILVAPPQAVKTYATGKGNASKELISVEVARRFRHVPADQLTTSDASDALVLAALGAAHLGRPVVDVPSHHRKALTQLAPIERTDP